METHYLRIKHWENLYENSRSRRVEKAAWVPIPNKHDGEGFCRIMDEKNGLEIFACWILILQIASKCKPRGSLIREDGSALDIFSIMLKTRMSKSKAKVLERAISMILQIGWLERVKCKSNTQLPLDVNTTAPEGNGIEGNGIETDTVVSVCSEPKALSPSQRIKFTDKEFIGIIESDYERWATAYPACNVTLEIARAHDWIVSNPTKTKSNYARYISTWLKNSQDRGGSRGSAQSPRHKTGYIPATDNPENDWDAVVKKQESENVQGK